MKRTFILFVLFFVVFHAFSTHIEKTTYVYAEKDSSVLKLDKYRLKDAEEIQPCVCFVFGVGFT
jgi:hypothetical protein